LQIIIENTVIEMTKEMIHVTIFKTIPPLYKVYLYERFLKPTSNGTLILFNHTVDWSIYVSMHCKIFG
jgi:hypothetical protein